MCTTRSFFLWLIFQNRRSKKSFEDKSLPHSADQCIDKHLRVSTINYQLFVETTWRAQLSFCVVRCLIDGAGCRVTDSRRPPTLLGPTNSRTPTYPTSLGMREGARPKKINIYLFVVSQLLRWLVGLLSFPNLRSIQKDRHPSVSLNHQFFRP